MYLKDTLVRKRGLALADEYGYYTTKQGDTFDIIALKLYDDEFKSSLLIQTNPQHISTIIFSAGVRLKYPVIEDEIPETLPPWKR